MIEYLPNKLDEAHEAMPAVADSAADKLAEAVNMLAELAELDARYAKVHNQTLEAVFTLDYVRHFS